VKFIKLTRTDDSPVAIAVSAICVILPGAKQYDHSAHTTLQLTDTSRHAVKETFDEIMKMIGS
jgi:hypothetical protein